MYPLTKSLKHNHIRRHKPMVMCIVLTQFYLFLVVFVFFLSVNLFVCFLNSHSPVNINTCMFVYGLCVYILNNILLVFILKQKRKEKKRRDVKQSDEFTLLLL